MNPALARRLGRITRDDPADLGTACLLISAALTTDDEVQAEHIVTVGRARLEALASTVQATGADVQRLHSALDAFGGSAEDYRALESSLLADTLVRQRGLPILVSVVWLEVARRAGIAASGLALPGHFVVAVGSQHEQSLAADVIAGTCVVVDPFNHGRVLELPDIVEIAGAHSADGGPVDPVELLAPAAPVDILHRILRNVRNWADRPERLHAALTACELGLALSRYPVGLERERAELLARTGRFVEAAAAYAAFADHVEHDDAEAAERARVLGRLAKARLN